MKTTVLWKLLLSRKTPGPILPGSLFLVLVNSPNSPALFPPQISPLIYQSLHFNNLSPTHTPNLGLHDILEHQGPHMHLAAPCSHKDPDPDKNTSSSATSLSPSDTLPVTASGSGFLELALSSSPYLLSSPSVLSQANRYVVQRSATPMPVASSVELLSRPLKATLRSSMKKRYHI